MIRNLGSMVVDYHTLGSLKGWKTRVSRGGVLGFTGFCLTSLSKFVGSSTGSISSNRKDLKEGGLELHDMLEAAMSFKKV